VPLYKTCQVDACTRRAPARLSRQRMCLSHYLDDALTRASNALRLCQAGEPVEPELMEWLAAQGEIAVELLARKDDHQALEMRARVLELLLCLTNVHEYVRNHCVVRVT
jgi:hypothetical protein